LLDSKANDRPDLADVTVLSVAPVTLARSGIVRVAFDGGDHAVLVHVTDGNAYV
jgi:hypothetical protein